MIIKLLNNMRGYGIIGIFSHMKIRIDTASAHDTFQNIDLNKQGNSSINQESSESTDTAESCEVLKAISKTCMIDWKISNSIWKIEMKKRENETKI